MARDGSGKAWVMQGAVIVSILAHASLIAAAGVRTERAPAPKDDLAPPVDTWAGTTSVPMGGELHEVDVTGSEIGGAPSPPPAPAPVAAPREPTEPPPPPPKPREPRNVAPPKAKTAPADKSPAPADESPAPGDESPAPADESPAPGDESPAPKKESPGSETSFPSSSNALPGSGDKVPAGTPAQGGGGSFGAEGTASVRDLGRAFTRALPPACDADKAWAKLPVGSAGSIEIAVMIGEDGKITGIEPLAQNPPSHLVNAAKRTVALLRGGIFALQGGSVTAGKQILRLSAELSDEAPPEDPSRAGAFGLASRWEGKRGVASFTQTSGRHVEITVEFLRVELTRG